MEENQNCKIPNITVTMIFEGSALNRNDKIGGNILSIKKLTINGDEKSFLSKVAIRHYLFQTLIRGYGWKASEIIKDGDVLQFDLLKDNILTCEELDVFGYMNTSMNQTRKSPLAITKAISLFPYTQDIAMYANHDLVRRAKEQGNLSIDTNPNPYNKEEHTSFYKITFTIDSEMIGKDKWIMSKCVIDDNEKILKLNYLKKDKSEKKENTPEIDSADNSVNAQAIENEEITESNQKKSKESKARDNSDDNNNDTKSIKIPFKNKRIDENGDIILEVKNGTIVIKNFKNNNCLIIFELNYAEKIRRIRNILDAIHDGLMAHTSGEDNTIIPLFLIAGDVKIPSPIFHPFIDIKRKNDSSFEVVGVNDALKNNWLLQNIYIQDCTRLKSQNINLNDYIKNNKIPNLSQHENWKEFMNSLNLTNDKQTQETENQQK
jgi:CRISPR-associated protein Cst2